MNNFTAECTCRYRVGYSGSFILTKAQVHINISADQKDIHRSNPIGDDLPQGQIYSCIQIWWNPSPIPQPTTSTRLHHIITVIPIVLLKLPFNVHFEQSTTTTLRKKNTVSNSANTFFKAVYVFYVTTYIHVYLYDVQGTGTSFFFYSVHRDTPCYHRYCVCPAPTRIRNAAVSCLLVESLTRSTTNAEQTITLRGTHSFVCTCGAPLPHFKF